MPKLFDLNKNNPFENSVLKAPKLLADFKKKTEKKQDKQKKKAKPAAKQEKSEKKSGGPITDFLPLVKVVLKFLDGFRRKLRVNVLDLKLIMAADDPCDLGVNYGKAWAAVGNLMPQLEKIFVIKKPPRKGRPFLTIQSDYRRFMVFM